LHTLSAYATNARLTLAQLSVPEKTNEITAIPDLRDILAEAGQLAGAVVTIDAMGCQVDIAQKILDHDAHFVLALKGNQPTLEADAVDYFKTPRSSRSHRTGRQNNPRNQNLYLLRPPRHRPHRRGHPRTLGRRKHALDPRCPVQGRSLPIPTRTRRKEHGRRSTLRSRPRPRSQSQGKRQNSLSDRNLEPRVPPNGPQPLIGVNPDSLPCKHNPANWPCNCKRCRREIDRLFDGERAFLEANPDRRFDCREFIEVKLPVGAAQARSPRGCGAEGLEAEGAWRPIMIRTSAQCDSRTAKTRRG
jgi:Transposase DDE domain